MTEPNVISYQEAATLTGRNISTIYRWVQRGHVRVTVLPDRFEWGVSRKDVETMAKKRWTRRPRHTTEGA